MTRKPGEIPEFESPEEEADFWDRHSAVDLLEEASVVDVDASRARAKRKSRSSQQISLRISSQVLARAKRRAGALGVPYQTLIQLWVAERLEQEEARAESLASERSRQS